MPTDRPQPGLSGALLLAELLPSAWAQWLQVEVDAILGVQDQLEQLDGWPQRVQGKLKSGASRGP